MDEEENELVVTIKSIAPAIAPDGITYDWGNVKIFFNGLEIIPAKFELILDSTSGNGPVIKINDVGEPGGRVRGGDMG